MSALPHHTINTQLTVKATTVPTTTSSTPAAAFTVFLTGSPTSQYLAKESNLPT
jgi:hypothetical protein